MDSSLLLTASADNSMRMWQVNGGKEFACWNTKAAVRSVSFAAGDKMACFVTDANMGQPSTIHVVSVEDDIRMICSFQKSYPFLSLDTEERILTIVVKGSKATIARWGKFNKTIITGHEDGTMSLWDASVRV